MRHLTIDPKRSPVQVHVFKSGLFRAFADDHVIEAPLPEGSLRAASDSGGNVLDIEAGDCPAELGRQHRASKRAGGHGHRQRNGSRRIGMGKPRD
jgi:hypothetical protein